MRVGAILYLREAAFFRWLPAHFFAEKPPLRGQVRLSEIETGVRCSIRP